MVQQSRRMRRRGAVGILAYRYERRRPMWGEQSNYLAGLLKTAQNLDVEAFVCGPQDISVSRNRVLAWTFTDEKGWRSHATSLPAVVYNRFFLRREPGAQRHLARYRALVSSRRLEFLSPQLPDKNRVQKILARGADFRPHLPWSVLYSSPRQVVHRLQRWNGLVLKPIRGQKGLGLWFIDRRADGYWLQSGTGRRRPLSERRLLLWCRRNLRPGRYQMQRWLALHDNQQRPRDVRVLVQRNQRGAVMVTGMGVRRGQPGGRVANLHRGGQAQPVDAAFSRVVPPAGALRRAVMRNNPNAGGDGDWGYNRPDVLAAAAAQGDPGASLALVAWRAFDLLNHRLGSFAELAIDLGIDVRGRIWFIEANSRPGRIIFRRLGDDETRRRAVAQPLLYARHVIRRASPNP